MRSTTPPIYDDRCTATMVARCHKLSLPCVRLDQDRLELLEPADRPAVHHDGEGDAAAAFFTSRAFGQLVRGWVDGHRGQTPEEVTPLFPGCWLLPLGRCSAQHPLQTMAVFLTEAALRSGPFGVVCQCAGINPGVIAERAEPWIQWEMKSPERVLQVLNWTREDLEAADRQDGLLGEFSDKLIQAYEETHVLFRITRFMASTGSPHEQIQLVCNQIQQILPFQWVIVSFKNQERVESSLRGQLIVAGELPECGGHFRGELAKLIESQTDDNWTRVLFPEENVLSCLVGGEIVCDPITYSGSVVGALLAGNKSGPDTAIASPEIQFIDAVADFFGTFHENAVRFAEQRALFMGMLRALTAAIDAKDPYTRGHSERVAFLSGAIALAMGQSDEAAERARIAGLVHDIGKIGVPEAILCKAGRLTDDEFAAIKRHPEIGHRILRDIDPLQDVLPGVLHHHERWDGRGYPHQLKGEAIPLIARIIGLADTFDAMSSTRSYRPALPRDHVLREIEKGAESQFDRRIVEAFRDIDLAGYDELLTKRPATEGPAMGIAA